MKRGLLAITLSLLSASIACKGGSGPRQVNPSLTIFLSVDGGQDLQMGDLIDGGIDFGTVPVLVPVVQTLVLGNNGGAPLTIGSFALLPDGGPFTLLVGTPTDVQAGANVLLPLQFVAPAQAAYEGTITFTSSDPNNPDVSIALRGLGSTQGGLTVTPDPVNFGAVGEGTSQIEVVTLQSNGTAALVVSDVVLAPGTDPAFSIVSAAPNPDAGSATIDAGDSVQIALQFSPVPGTPIFIDGGTNALLITSNDPNHQPAYSVGLVAQMIGAPVAIIADPGVVPVGATVTLDGGASYDPGNLYPLSYSWALVRSPPGSTSGLSSTTVAFPMIYADQPGDYDFSLSVTNDAGVQCLTPATARLTARPSEDIYVQLVWVPHDAPTTQSLVDLDLHFLATSLDAGLNGPDDCFWANPTPGYDGGPFQATCSGDQIIGPGPEWAGYANPPDATTYTIAVDYYSDHNQAPETDATVRIFIYGILEAEIVQTLSTPGEVWWTAEVNWPWLLDGGIVVLVDGGVPP